MKRVLEEFETSGKTLREFAESKGLEPKRLSWWKHRLKSSVAPAAPVPRRAVEVPSRSLFVPVTVASVPPPAPSTAAPFELELREGRTLRVPSDFDGSGLARLVTALKETGAW